MNRNSLIFGVLMAAAAVGVVQAKGPTKKDSAAKHGSGGRPVAVFQEAAVYRPGSFEESVLIGQAALVQAKAQARLFDAQSAILKQQARADKEFADKLHAATFHEKRRIYAESEAANRPARLTNGEYAALAKPSAPERLSATSYDRISGRLTWPSALAAEEFATERAALDAAFAVRDSNDVGPHSDFHRQVQSLTEAALGKLKSQVGAIPPQETVAAKKFLRALAAETRYPMPAPSLASAE